MQSPTNQPHHGATHAPKHETFDIDSKTKIDPKGFTRNVDKYVETSFGLYMARGADHPRFAYIEAWLLREPDIRPLSARDESQRAAHRQARVLYRHRTQCA